MKTYGQMSLHTTYSTVDISGKKVQKKSTNWYIQADPHVVMKLKRVFEKVAKEQTGTIKISDTAENARDLLWFISRYPLEVTPLEHLQARAEEYDRLSARVESILSADYTPSEFALTYPPRAYQRQAADMALHTRSLLLCDDTGVGKTISAICMLCDPRTLPAVVVCLSHLQIQWEQELKRFIPRLRVHIVKKGQPYPLDRFRGRPVPIPDVLVMSYSKLAGWADELARFAKLAIYDEVQELRHHTTFRYAAAQTLAANVPFRLGMSATPIYGWGGEFFSIADAIRPGTLGSRDEFIREWCAGSSEDKPRVKDPIRFGLHLRDQGLLLRRTRKDVGREMPAVQKIIHTIDADVSALARVEDTAAELARIILASGEKQRGDKLNASERLSNVLRQATGIAKAVFVADFVKLLLESEPSVVLYGYHREVYSIWESMFKDIKPAWFTGTEDPKEKDRQLKRFLNRETPLMIMSLRAGAGTDGMQAVCRTVVVGELDWAPPIHEQAVSRIDRDGQREPVTAYFLVSEQGSDPIIAEVNGLKLMQQQQIRDPQDTTGIAPAVTTTNPNHIRMLALDVLRRRQLTQ